jgi:outer membrane protein TolC
LKNTLFHQFYKDIQVRKVEISKPLYSGSLDSGKLMLTEGEAVQMALVNNLGLNVERYANLSGIWDIKLQESVYDPVGTFGLNWDKRTTPTASILQGGPTVTDINTAYTFGYRHPFSTGSALEVGFSGVRNRSTNLFASLVPSIQSQFQITLRQDLLQGFWKSQSEYTIEISRNNLEITEQQFKRLIIDTIVQVQDRFWELEFALKDLEVKSKSLEYAETLLEQNRARFEVGSAARLEVVESEAEVASRREQFISAEYYYRQVQDQLIQLISDFEDPHTFRGEIVPVSSKGDPHKTDEEFDRLLEIATEMRPEIQQADLNELNFEINLDQSRDRLKPSLEGVFGFEMYGLGGNQIIRDYSQGFLEAPVVGVVVGGLGDSMSQLLTGSFRGFVAGFNLQIPIKNEDALASNALAQIDLNRAKMQKRALRQSIALEIRDALTQIQMNEARVEATQEAVRAAEERLRGEEARFEVGMGTTRQLIEAQRDLLATVSTQVRARTDQIKSYALLDKVIGRSMERQNIKLEDAIVKNLYEME